MTDEEFRLFWLGAVVGGLIGMTVWLGLVIIGVERAFGPVVLTGQGMVISFLWVRHWTTP